MLLPQLLPSIPDELCLYSLSSFPPFAHFAAFQSSVIIPAFQAPQSSFPLCSKPTAGQRPRCYSVLPTFPSYCTEKKGPKKQMALLLHLVCLCMQQILFQGFIPCILYCFTQFCLWAQRPESRAKVKSNSGKESKHWSLICSAYYESSRESRALICWKTRFFFFFFFWFQFFLLFLAEKLPWGGDSRQLYFPFVSPCCLDTPLCFSFIVLLSTCQSVFLLALEGVKSLIV